jgi:hypothetical protein
MHPILIVLLVCFTMVMFLWLLTLLGAVGTPNASPWLAFFACLILGIVLFLTGSGFVVARASLPLLFPLA